METLNDRDEFEQAVQDARASHWLNAKKNDVVRRYCAAFENCHDIMPGTLCDELEVPRGSTFAQGVRDMSRWLGRKAIEPIPAA